MSKSKYMKGKRNNGRFFNVNLGTKIVLIVPIFFLLFMGFWFLRQLSLNSNKIVESRTDISILQKMKPIVVNATKHDLQGDTGDLKNSNWFATIQKEMTQASDVLGLIVFRADCVNRYGNSAFIESLNVEDNAEINEGASYDYHGSDATEISMTASGFVESNRVSAGLVSYVALAAF